MEKRTSAFARIFAAIALAGAVVVVIVAISSSLGDSDSSTKSRGGNGGGHPHRSGPKTTAKTYVVKSGDTLVAIAHRTGVPVAHILALNPEVDPQILIAGETLKLRYERANRHGDLRVFESGAIGARNPMLSRRSLGAALGAVLLAMLCLSGPAVAAARPHPEAKAWTLIDARTGAVSPPTPPPGSCRSPAPPS